MNDNHSSGTQNRKEPMFVVLNGKLSYAHQIAGAAKCTVYIYI